MDSSGKLAFFRLLNIGETGRPFIERWKEHLYDIKVKRPYPVARHFNENDDHKKATFHTKILNLINGTAERATQRRKYKGSRWIRTFKSFQPEGINLREQGRKMANFPDESIPSNYHHFQNLKYTPSVPPMRTPLSYYQWFYSGGGSSAGASSWKVHNLNPRPPHGCDVTLEIKIIYTCTIQMYPSNNVCCSMYLYTMCLSRKQI